jgi:hypothetical protein
MDTSLGMNMIAFSLLYRDGELHAPVSQSLLDFRETKALTSGELEIFYVTVVLRWPPLWFSGQSSWLQIRRPGFDSRQYQKKKVLGLERGPPSLVSTTKELLDRKVAAPV